MDERGESSILQSKVPCNPSFKNHGQQALPAPCGRSWASRSLPLEQWFSSWKPTELLPFRSRDDWLIYRGRRLKRSSYGLPSQGNSLLRKSFVCSEALCA